MTEEHRNTPATGSDTTASGSDTTATGSDAPASGSDATDAGSADTRPAAREGTGDSGLDWAERDPVVRVAGVSFSYGDTPAVEDVSLTIREGEFLGLVGPNGSGKTTLLQLVLGLLEPDAGTVELFGEPVDRFEEGERIGYVAQQSSGAGDRMPITVREVVTMGRYPHAGFGRLDADDRERVDAAMERVGIADLADRRIGGLSGGQEQRVFIARALASEADLLALDEPTVGVDAESRDRFYGLLDDLNDRGITIVLIEHDIGVVTDRADRIACINRTLFHHGDTASFVESDALDQAYGEANTVVEHHH